MPKCEACGCSFEHIMGPNGKAIPVQKVRVLYRKIGDELVKLTSGPELFVSHFETCSDPSRFSRGRAG